MTALEVCAVALAVLAYALVSGRLRRTPITMPMLFVAFGLLTGGLDLISLGTGGEGDTGFDVTLLAEVTLAVILFGDAVRIDVGALRRELGLPARLLGIGLPLAILLGTPVVRLFLPELGWWGAALVAAILAPTDAALGQAVVEEPTVPRRVRQALNVESGLNDGIALPAVFLFAALVAGETAEPGFWAAFAGRQIGLGVLTGVVVGGIGALAIDAARTRQWVDGIWVQLGTLAIAVTTYAGATAVEGNGFIAAFVGGLTFGLVADDGDHVAEYTEDSAQLLAALTFFVFGNAVVPEVTDTLTLPVAACAIAALTVGRLVPVAIAMVGAGVRPPTVAFLGWFGPRGLASIVFALLVIEEGIPGAEEIAGIVTWTVLASVLLHGLTATPGATAYGRWYDAVRDDHDDMGESQPITDQRVRFGADPAP